EVHVCRVNLVTADTALTPDEGRTTSSMSLETSGNAIRYATAEARHVLLTLAFEELEAAALDDLVVDDGTIRDTGSGRAVTYWQLLGGKRFGRPVSGTIQPKQAENYKVVGQSTRRIDLLAKVMGQPSYVHDLDLPHMVHGRVVRPPHYYARLVSVDTDAVEALPGVLKVVRNGSFLGVIAEREAQAVAAMIQLRATAVWEADKTLLPPTQLFDHLNSASADSFLLIDGTPTQEPIPAVVTPPTAAHSRKATYRRPYQMHAALGPSAAVAHWHEEQLTVWTHSQGVFPTRTILAQVLGVDEQTMHVIQMEGPGCYGHNGSDDAALDAALLARAVPNRPLMLKWSRADEHAWEPYGPAMQVQVQGSVDDSGHIDSWHYDVWSYPHLGRGRPDVRTSGLLAAWHLEEPFEQPVPQPPLWPHVGGYRNADPLYDLPERRVVTHFVAESPLRTSTLRSLGAYTNVFAIESFMDELAHAAGVDPVEFRLRHLSDERARAVIQAAAEKAGWHQTPPSKREGFGRGIAFAQYKNRQCYAAIIVELHVERASGRIQLERAVIAADAGLVVNPDGLCNQLEGGFLQAASWTLYEAVQFDEQGITSTDWLTYPILRFPAAPRLETVLLNRPDMPFLGSGEATQGPAPAAIANAVFDAVGVRLREIPFTPERVSAALAS
ncbi:MAG: molybdopterin-dependent oxidoreductase, partial [Anaerolineales bacterium]|nr:molybdopterin-dependent oxidoreductase [Anaerolineales bacterium]